VADNIVPDGDSDFSTGQDASKIPSRIPPNSYAAGINVSAKNGALSPRWGWEEIDLKFPSGGVTGTDGRFRSWKSVFESGKFQAGAPYVIGQDFYSLIVVNGILFLINNKSFTVSVITLVGESLDFGADRLNWTPADKYFVVFDYPARPVILDGVHARRSDKTKSEVPISRLGALNSNRVFIADGGNEFTAGDPIGSNGPGVNAPITFEEILKSGSNFFGQIFKLPSNYHNEVITGMAFLQATDTSTGIGPLLVGTKNIVASYAAHTPRANWQQEQFGSILLFNAGIAGARSFVNVGSDLFIQSGDGQIRTIAMAREEQHRFSKVPISVEIENWLKFWDIDLAKFGVLGYHKNKIFVAVNPYRTEAIDNNGKVTTDVAHGGVAVLELDNVTSFGEASKPAWAGLWTGVNPMEFILSDNDLFVVSKDNQKINKLYRARPDRTYDTSGTNLNYIRSRVYTRGYVHQAPLNDKDLLSLELEVSAASGPLEIKAAYSPSHAETFIPWANTFQQDIKFQECDMAKASPTGYGKQGFKSINFGSPPPNVCNEATKELLAKYHNVQIRLDITGRTWSLNSVVVNARVLPKVFNNISCPKYSAIPLEIPAECNDDWKL
jgi:hypothetical protein